jgi:hypothetical protein
MSNAALPAEIDRDAVELFRATAAMSIGDSIRAKAAQDGEGRPSRCARPSTDRAAYLDIAELVGEQDRDDFMNVAVGLAVLAGIAASDAISGSRLGQINGGDNRRDAAELLVQATPDGTSCRRRSSG